MSPDQLKETIELNRKWRFGEDGGSRANLSRANLSDADLSGANLSDADLSGADLSRANLSDADLSRANLSRADLSGANLSRADLSGADLSGADLSGANLSRANLSDADLSGANLSDANLSDANGLISPREYMDKHFVKDDTGYVVYKGFGNTDYAPPKIWKIEAGQYITEVCNPSRGTCCGCGVNFATEKWIRRNYPSSTVWQCHIDFEDACGIVVPFHSDGKARCDRLKLISPVSK